MIISHKHKFIFIKTRKTGGTSVEKAINLHCGDEDVLTLDHLHKSETDELAEYAKNYQGSWLPFRELMHSQSFFDSARITRDWLTRPKFYNHMTAISVKSRIPKKIWDSYYKFAFERNPWDKCISFYYWQSRMGRNYGDFNEYIKQLKGGKTIDQALPSDWRRYAHNGKVIVDEVFDFADLEGNLKKALSNTDYPLDEKPLDMPHMKGGIRKKNFEYTQETIDLVAEYFKNEIEHFKFEPTAYL